MKPNTPQADQQPPPEQRQQPPLRSPRKTFAIVALILSLLFAGLIFIFTKDWPLYWIWFAAVNPVTLMLYGFDKFQAWRGRLRVPESVLHGLSLSGGLAGGWFGVFLFRHKKRKVTFWLVLTIATLLHGGIIFYLQLIF